MGVDCAPSPEPGPQLVARFQLGIVTHMKPHDSSTWPQLVEVAIAAAQAGAAAALPHFRRADLQVEHKDDDSPVTIADRQAEAAIRAVIRDACPDDGWLGEEAGTVIGRSTRRWIVDPIDGTRNFVRGIPLWATLVACEDLVEGGSRPVAAAVLIPGLDECYHAGLGGGAWYRRADAAPVAIAVSDIHDFGQALWCFETPTWFAACGRSRVFTTMTERCGLHRGLGDAYGHMLVASGRAEVVIEPHLAIWDVAATSLVVSEAGGRFSDLDGNDRLDSGHALVTNGHLHQATLDIVRRDSDAPTP